MKPLVINWNKMKNSKDGVVFPLDETAAAKQRGKSAVRQTEESILGREGFGDLRDKINSTEFAVGEFRVRKIFHLSFGCLLPSYYLSIGFWSWRKKKENAFDQ